MNVDIKTTSVDIKNTINVDSCLKGKKKHNDCRRIANFLSTERGKETIP